MKEVLQAMRANDGTSSMAISHQNLEKLANVSISHVPKQQHIFSLFRTFLNPACVLISDITDYRCYRQEVTV